MSQTENKIVRINFKLNLNDKSEKNIYDLLEKKSNKSQYIKESIIYRMNGINLKPDAEEGIRKVIEDTIKTDIKDVIRDIIRTELREILTDKEIELQPDLSEEKGKEIPAMEEEEVSDPTITTEDDFVNLDGIDEMF